MAEAYRNEMHAVLQVTHPYISNAVDAAVNDLEKAVQLLDPTDVSIAQIRLTNAIAAFDTAILDTTGLFGTHGVVTGVVARQGYIPHNLTVHRSATTIGAVSGDAVGGLATLTATLTTTSGGQSLAGKAIVFTLDGAFAGIALTDGDGVAILSDTPTSASVGTSTGSVVASSRVTSKTLPRVPPAT